MRTKMIYIADDGKEFETVFDCEEYEKEMERKKKEEDKAACEAFFLSIGIDLSAYKTVLELNQNIGLGYLIFDKQGEAKGIKTVGGGASNRYGVVCDFVYVSSSEKSDNTLVNWLEKHSLYAHALSSFLHRNKEFYEWSLLDKLKNLGWEVKDGLLHNTG